MLSSGSCLGIFGSERVKFFLAVSKGLRPLRAICFGHFDLLNAWTEVRALAPTGTLVAREKPTMRRNWRVRSAHNPRNNYQLYFSLTLQGIAVSVCARTE